jgi:thiamine biosynthesis lipoprotein
MRAEARSVPSSSGAASGLARGPASVAGDGAGSRGVGAENVVCLAIAAMGTRFEIVLRAQDGRHGQAAGELALEEIRLAHERLSAFAPSSLVSAINRRGGAGPTKVDPATFDLLALAAEVHAASGGAFDITLGPLMRAWGFRGDGLGAPSPEAAERARLICGMGLLALDRASRRVALGAVGAQLDLGALAKGHALDLAGAVLREHGVECALLHAGTSTALALGAPPRQEGWKIALADRGRRLGPVVTLRDQALSVSSPSGRVVEIDGAAHGHVLDPRTGAPACGGRYAAAVFAAEGGGNNACARADAWSTALLVCGARPAGAPGELASLILPAAEPRAGIGPWRLEGPGAGGFELSGAGTAGIDAALEEISV